MKLLKKLIPKEPFLALISLVLAISIFIWVKQNPGKTTNVLKQEHEVRECKEAQE